MKGLLTTYRTYLPITNSTPPLSLGEGDIPLVSAPAVSREIGAEVWLKLEECQVAKSRSAGQVSNFSLPTSNS